MPSQFEKTLAEFREDDFTNDTKRVGFNNVSFRWNNTYIKGKRYSVVSKDDS